MKNKKLALVLGLIMATAFIKARTQSIQFDKLYSIESDIVVVGEIVEIHDEGRFILKIKTINDNKVTNNRKLQVYAKNQVAAVGETVIINGEYSTGSYARNEGVFNYKQYMQSKGIVR